MGVSSRSLKTVSGKVVAPGINILVGGRPLPLKSWLQVTYPLLKAASFDTFCFVAPQPYEVEQEGQHPLAGQRAANFKRDLEAT